jgi:hypothetical protein
MSNGAVGAEASWGLDDEIEQAERMVEIWERQADKHQGTPFGETIEGVARGYKLQLDALRESRAKRDGDI